MASLAASALSDRAARSPLLLRRAILFGAALAGGGLGAAFGIEIAQAAAGLWNAYTVPAFFEILLSGIPLCG